VSSLAPLRASDRLTHGRNQLAREQRRAISVAAIQQRPNLPRRRDQLIRLGARDLFAALRLDGADEGSEGVARGADAITRFRESWQRTW